MLVNDLHDFSPTDNEPSAIAHLAEPCICFITYPFGEQWEIGRFGNELSIRNSHINEQREFIIRIKAPSENSQSITIESMEHLEDSIQISPLLSAIEYLFSAFTNINAISIDLPTSSDASSKIRELISAGAFITNSQGQITAIRDLFWQQSSLWLPENRPAFPLHYTFSNQSRHPLRPNKPSGVVYQRFIPWLGKQLSFRTIDIENDLEHFNRWMNDDIVANFWQEQGDYDKHRAYLKKIESDPHAFGLFGCFDGEPFSYFEIYWAKEDRIAPYYDCHDFDRGWHALVGEAKYRGKPYVTAWLPSISHYLFLDDCRTQRIVIEPRSDNQKMIRNLMLSGYANLKEFNFPHKRAVLGMLLRERFFSEQHWIPRQLSASTKTTALKDPPFANISPPSNI